MERLSKSATGITTTSPLISTVISVSAPPSPGDFLTIFMTHLIHKPIEAGLSSQCRSTGICFCVFVTVLFVYDSIICTEGKRTFGKSLEAMQKLRAELDNLQVQRAPQDECRRPLAGRQRRTAGSDRGKEFRAARSHRNEYRRIPGKAGTKFKSIKGKTGCRYVPDPGKSRSCRRFHPRSLQCQP